jgi:ATP-dependent Clp protease ATP-binding subunit ClpC
MFERFTDRARRVIVNAQEEARNLSQDRLSPEHILLGLVREGSGLAAKALESLGISLETIRERVEGAVGRGDQAPPSGHIPFTEQSKDLLKNSLRASHDLGHDYIGTEHILLGVFSQGESVAVRVLTGLGADYGRVRAEVTRLLEEYQRRHGQAG